MDTGAIAQITLHHRITTQGLAGLIPGDALDELRQRHFDTTPLSWVELTADLLNAHPCERIQQQATELWLVHRLSDAEVEQQILPLLSSNAAFDLCPDNSQRLALWRSLYQPLIQHHRHALTQPQPEPALPSRRLDSSGLRSILSGHFGNRVIELMEKANRLHMVNSASDLPESIRARHSKLLNSIAGATFGDGTVYLVADKIAPQKAAAIFLHEVGEHAGMATMLGKDYGRLVQQFRRLLARGDSYATWAAMRVPRSTPAAHVPSEQLAYLIEKVATDQQPDPAGIEGHALGKECLSHLRGWLFRTPLMSWLDTIGEADHFTLNPEDIAALARQAVDDQALSLTDAPLEKNQATAWIEELDPDRLDTLFRCNARQRRMVLGESAPEALAGYLYALKVARAQDIDETIDDYIPALARMAAGEHGDHLTVIAGELMEYAASREPVRAFRAQMGEGGIAMFRSTASDGTPTLRVITGNPDDELLTVRHFKRGVGYVMHEMLDRETVEASLTGAVLPVQQADYGAVLAEHAKVETAQASSRLDQWRKQAQATVQPMFTTGSDGLVCVRGCDAIHLPTPLREQLGDKPVAISLSNPAINQPRSHLISASDLTRTIGATNARMIVLTEESAVYESASWQQLAESTGATTVAELMDSAPDRLGECEIPAALVFNNPRYRALFVDAGYDGAIYGTATHTGCTLSHAFTAQQIAPYSRFGALETNDGMEGIATRFDAYQRAYWDYQTEEAKELSGAGNVDALFDASTRMAESQEALADAMGSSSFVCIAGSRRSGEQVFLTPSAKQRGWQITHLGDDGQPISDTLHTSKEEACADLLRAIVPNSLRLHADTGVVLRPNGQEVEATAPQVLSEVPRNTFAGESAHGASIDKLEKAKELLEQGRPAINIHAETGWFRGFDGKWRYEISDDQADFRHVQIDLEALKQKLLPDVTYSVTDTGLVRAAYQYDTPNYLGAFGRTETDALNALAFQYAKNHMDPPFDIEQVKAGDNFALMDVLDHPELFAAYPYLKHTIVEFQNDDQNRGAFYEHQNLITLNLNRPKDEMLSTLLHEIQHSIQAREMFARGGNADSSFTGSIRQMLQGLHEDATVELEVWKRDNQNLIDDADAAAEVAQAALMYESVQSLIRYANRDAPSGVFRLIRNELGWNYHPAIQDNPTRRAKAREIDYMLADLPRRGPRRNAGIRAVCETAIDLYLECIPSDLLKQFRNDERTLKGMVKAMQREAQKKNDLLDPMQAMKRDVVGAEALFRRHKFNGPFDIYRSLAGEVESRMTQKRQHLTAEQRTNRFPMHDSDVNPSDVIVYYRGSAVHLPSLDTSASKLDQTETPEFKRWFGDSKVVDADGKPLVVYHGTTADFSAFDPERVGERFGRDQDGFFFTGNTITASGFADPQSQFLAAGMSDPDALGRSPRSGANVMPAYLSLQNPLTLDEYTYAFDTTPKREIDDAGLSLIDYFDDNRRSVVAYAKEGGYDGVLFQRNGQTFAVAFRPVQIKSAIGNRGTFDPTNPDIRFSRTGVERAAQGRVDGGDVAFSEWFADSKIVDAEGKPLVVYHGTVGDFDVFDPERAGTMQYSDWGPGIYFTPHASNADFYRAEAAKNADTVGAEMWAQLEEMEKQAVWRNGAPEYPDGYSELLNKWRAHRAVVEDEAGTIMPVYLSVQNPLIQEYQRMPDPDLAARAQAAGHDGIIVLTGSGKIDEIVVFSPEQIKSAIGNVGTFDPNNPDIRYSLTPSATPVNRAYTPSYHMQDWIEQTGLPPATIEQYARLGEQQRRQPQAAMIAAQKLLGATNPLAPAIEHIGDLTNRMSPKHSVAFAFEETREQIERGLRILKGGAGFRQEYEQALAQAADHQGISLDEHKRRVDKALKAYADAHDDLNAHAPLQRMARDAAVALGRGRFEKATRLLEDMLSRMQSLPEFIHELGGHTGQTRTHEFEQWFGDSQIIDEHGRPLVLYHGTNRDFTVFNPDASREGDQTLFATTSHSVASAFALYRSVWDGANVMPIYVKADRVLEVEGGYRPIREVEAAPGLDGMQDGESLRDFARRMGYDAIRIRNTDDQIGPSILPASDIYILLPSAQIKSAIGNIGAFDPANPDIRFSHTEQENQASASAHGFFDPELIDEMATPEYKSREKLIDMPIADFLALAREGRGIEKAAVVRQLIDSGTRFNSLPYLHVDVNGRVIGHEGRHRARALAEQGYTTMPVILQTADLRWSEQADPNLRDYVTDWPTTIQAEEGAQDPDLILPFPVTREQATQPYQPAGATAATNQTDTPEFKRWFGESLVVDDNGNPQVMYHGSYQDLTWFDRLWSTNVRKPSMDTVGSWFTDTPGMNGAEQYANGEGATIYPVYLSITRPKVYDQFDDFLRDMHEANGDRLEDMNPKGIGSPEALREKLKLQGYDGIAFTKTNTQALHDEIKDLTDAVERANNEYRDAINEARERGIEFGKADGAPYQAKIDRLVESLQQAHREQAEVGASTEFDQQYVWIAFEPTQIKSAIGNRGTFDPNNADIRFTFAGTGAVTHDPYTLALAQEQIQAGIDPELVRQQTGWHQGVDGKWRYEISDADARIRPAAQWAINDAQDQLLLAQDKLARAEAERDAITRFYDSAPANPPVAPASTPEYRGAEDRIDDAAEAVREAQERVEALVARGLRVGDVLDHPALFAAYPSLADTRLSFRATDSVGAAYYPGADLIVVDSRADGDLASILTHELQHAIQTKEGFARGGTEQEFQDRDTTDEYIAIIQQQISDILSANPALRELHRQRQQALAAITEQYGENTGRATRIRWEAVPDTERTAYMALTRELANSPEHQAIAELESARFYAERDRVITPAHQQYHRLAGEVEARNVVTRMGMTDDQRQQVAPGRTQDTPDEDVIVLFNGEAMASAPLPQNARPNTTEPRQATNPVFDFTPPLDGNVIREYKLGDTRISLSISSMTDEVSISSIRTPRSKRGRGSARAAMEQLIAQADAEQVVLTLGASPLDNRTNLTQLISFYESLGFSDSGRKVNMLGHPVMGRSPRRPGLNAQDKANQFLQKFAGSKVVDEQGRPLVLYHGTRPGNDIEQFMVPNHDGVYFTPDIDYAESYTDGLFDDEGAAGPVYPVYVDLKNPYIVRSTEGAEQWDQFIYRGLDREALQAQGYDGAMLYHEEHGLDQVVAFDSKQITFAIGLQDALKQPVAPASVKIDKQVQAPEFKAWFDNSHVVTADGEPLRVYHGTARDFRVFSADFQGDTFADLESAIPRDGFWFTSDPASASWYANQSARSQAGDGDASGQRILPVYLSLQNPFYYTVAMYAEEGRSGIPSQSELESQGYDGLIIEVPSDDEPDTPEADAMWEQYTPIYGSPLSWPADLRDEYNRLLDTPPMIDRMEYVAFRPEQIVSAISSSSDLGADLRFSRVQGNEQPLKLAIRPSDLALAPEELTSRDRMVPPNGTTPAEPDDLPLGSIRLPQYGGDIEDRYVSILTEVPVDALLLSEPEDRIRSHPSFARYVQWAKDGLEAPAIAVNQTPEGHLIAVNRRRVLAAREAGISSIRAWVSPINPVTGDPLKYRDILAMVPGQSLKAGLAAAAAPEPEATAPATAADSAVAALSLLDAIRIAYDDGELDKVDELTDSIESLIGDMDADAAIAAQPYDEDAISPATEYLARAYADSLRHPGAGPDINRLRASVIELADHFGGLRENVDDGLILASAEDAYEQVRIPLAGTSRPRFSPELEHLLYGEQSRPQAGAQGLRVDDVMFHNAISPMLNQFGQWSQNSHVVNEKGAPKVVFAVEPMGSTPDANEAAYLAGTGSKRFMDFDTAWAEAEANLTVGADGLAQPYQITPAYLSLKRPVPGMNGHQTTASFSKLASAMGVDAALALVAESGQEVPMIQTGTGTHMRDPNSEIQIAPILDSPRCIRMLKEAGYDGAAYAVAAKDGSVRTEYRVFTSDQVLAGCPMAVITTDNAGDGLRFSISASITNHQGINSQPSASASEAVKVAIQRSAAELPLSLQLDHLPGLRLSGNRDDIDQHLDAEVQSALIACNESVDELEGRIKWLGRSHEGGRHYEKTAQKLEQVKAEQRQLQRWAGPSRHTHMPWDKPLGKGLMKALSTVVSLKPGEQVTGKMAVFLAATTHGSIEEGVAKLMKAGIKGIDAGGDVLSWDSANMGLAEHLTMRQQGERFHIAYHGSPHEFDEFDLAHIGSGEGAQAYGRGIYCTDTLRVAGHYQNLTQLHAVYFEETLYPHIDDLIADVVPRICEKHPELAVQPSELHKRLGLQPEGSTLEAPLTHYLRTLAINPPHAEVVLERYPSLAGILKKEGQGLMKYHDQGRDLIVFPRGGVRGINEINAADDNTYRLALYEVESRLNWFVKASSSDEAMAEQFERYLTEIADTEQYDNAIEHIEAKLAESPGDEFYEGQLFDARWKRSQAEAVQQLIQDYGPLKVVRAAPRGTIYMVDIDIVEDQYLHFDKRISAQPESVKVALWNVVHALSEPYQSAAADLINADSVASEVYEAMHQHHSLREAPGSLNAVQREDALARQLNSAGIHGIKYEDGLTQRGGGEGEKTYNYVVFDTARMTIVGRTNERNPEPEHFEPVDAPEQKVRAGMRMR